jgi:membrane-associated protease RseP (regulator of RpoE activity)
MADSADGTVLIMGNPPLMDLLGTWVLGAPPGRFDILSPLALAAWVGCLLTCMNLLPIGQLDGGHVARALWPTHADQIGKVVLALGLLAGFLWVGWAVWAVLLWSLGAARGLEVPVRPGLTRRARWIAVMAGVAFGLTFMPRPVETDILGVPVAPAEPGVSVP